MASAENVTRAATVIRPSSTSSPPSTRTARFSTICSSERARAAPTRGEEIGVGLSLERAREAGRIASVVAKNEVLLAGAKPPKAEVAIVYAAAQIDAEDGTFVLVGDAAIDPWIFSAGVAYRFNLFGGHAEAASLK